MMLLEEILKAMSIPMEIIPSYGLFHILYVVLGFSICGSIAYLLRNKNEKQVIKILFIIGIVLIVSEIWKQLFYYFVVMDHKYSWSDFPFHLCSVPMYLCVVLPFIKNEKTRRSIYSFMALYNLLGGAISFVEPSGLFLNETCLTIHACLWHMILVFIGLLILFTKLGGNTFEDYVGSTKLFLVLSVIAFIMNCFVQFVLHEHMNMFFVGPGNSPLAVFSLFSEWFGWYINTFIYLFAVALGSYIIYVIIYYIQNKTLPFKKS